ncbi:hypothetical protein LSH36_320g06005 [Paralvinella palmiformis]|uniref:G-protein coupled receptors family 1 profile domain-containing protein n=1 Tax=Paralvinella palmiformis TaxID=53620 RepID=A0AAD9N103_9ANNE|nr:hypothetical protein LSH36_320g06005 [Paralvinella palmiformis]
MDAWPTATADNNVSAANATAGYEIVSDLIENAAVRYTLVTLHVLAICLASVGNGFLIVFIGRHWKRTHRNVTAILILNLAACDFINAVCYQPMRLVDILVYDEQRLTFCRVTGFFSSFMAGVGFALMVAIAQERFLLICHPFRAKRLLTMRNTVAVMVAIWLGVAICAVPLPIGSIYVIEVHLASGVARFCLVNVTVDRSFRGDVYFACLFVLFFLVPLVVITFSYVSIFRRLHHAFPGQGHTDRAAVRLLRQRQSLAKVMLSTAVIFVTSQGPHWITFLISACGYEIRNNPIFTLLVVDLLTMVSPSLNPIVYSIRYNTVKKGITRSTGGGSIYGALRKMSLQRNSAVPSDTPLTSLVQDNGGPADPAAAQCLRSEDGMRFADGRSISYSDQRQLDFGRHSGSDLQANGNEPLRQTIFATNGKVLRKPSRFVRRGRRITSHQERRRNSQHSTTILRYGRLMNHHTANIQSFTSTYKPDSYVTPYVYKTLTTFHIHNTLPTTG